MCNFKCFECEKIFKMEEDLLVICPRCGYENPYNLDYNDNEEFNFSLDDYEKMF